MGFELWRAIQGSQAMELGEFWDKVEQSKRWSRELGEPREQALAMVLSMGSPADVASFQRRLMQLAQSAQRLQAIAKLARGEEPARALALGLVALGRLAFEAAWGQGGALPEGLASFEFFELAAVDAFCEPVRSDMRRRAERACAMVAAREVAGAAPDPGRSGAPPRI